MSCETKSSSRVFMPMRPGAAAALLAIDGDGRALEVALMADRDGDLLVGDQVFELQLGGFRR